MGLREQEVCFDGFVHMGIGAFFMDVLQHINHIYVSMYIRRLVKTVSLICCNLL